jgi:hypothetical protein
MIFPPLEAVLDDSTQISFRRGSESDMPVCRARPTNDSPLHQRLRPLHQRPVLTLCSNLKGLTGFVVFEDGFPLEVDELPVIFRAAHTAFIWAIEILSISP